MLDAVLLKERVAAIAEPAIVQLTEVGSQEPFEGGDERVTVQAMASVSS